MRLSINDSQILWPGKLKKKPEGIIIPTHLKVLTIEEKPFIYVRRLEEDEAMCDPQDEIPCPLFNATDGTGEFHCWWIGLFLVFAASFSLPFHILFPPVNHTSASVSVRTASFSGNSIFTNSIFLPWNK